MLALVVVTIAIIVLFDYTNGFHDASNIVATVIASRAMTPLQAVCLVAFFEFLGPLLGGTAVADTIGAFVRTGGVPVAMALVIVLCGVLGAVGWNLFTWWFGVPSSSTHALVGGLAGAVTASIGAEHVVWGLAELRSGRLAGVTKILAALLLSPLLGFALGFAVHRLARFLLRGARPSVNRRLRSVQVLTPGGFRFAMGANDAQKSMGIITLVLVTSGLLPSFHVPIWVIVTCASAMTLGILSGGWRIVRTVGFGIYKLGPLHAVDAQVTAGAVIFGSALVGAPASTTHVVSSSIMGIGASERPRAVRWRKGREILAAWVVTLPGAGALGAALCLATRSLWRVAS
jgi:PiT family inorganic phosphate transporter